MKHAWGWFAGASVLLAIISLVAFVERNGPMCVAFAVTSVYAVWCARKVYKLGNP